MVFIRDMNVAIIAEFYHLPAHQQDTKENILLRKKNGAEILSHIGGHIHKSESSQFHMRRTLCDSRFVGQVSFSTTKYYLSTYTNAKVLPYIYMYMYILISAIQKSNCSTNKWHCSNFFFEFQFGYIEYYNHYNNALLLISSGHL